MGVSISNGFLKPILERKHPKNPLQLGMSMFDPTREHDTNPTRVFPG